MEMRQMNDNSNSKPLALWLLMLSLAALVTFSTVILIKSVLSKDTEVVTTVKNVGATQGGEKETAEPAPEPTPTATPEPYMVEQRLDAGYIEHHVVGQVFGVDPAEYAVVIFIKVDGVYYIKPSWQYGKTYLENDGTFNARAYTDDDYKWSDQSATAYSVFCVPADFNVYDMYDFSDISTVRGASILAQEDLPTGN
jgi:hypothetical protein